MAKRIQRRDKSFVCHEDLWSVQGMVAEIVDGFLQANCSRTGNETE